MRVFTVENAVIWPKEKLNLKEPKEEQNYGL